MPVSWIMPWWSERQPPGSNNDCKDQTFPLPADSARPIDYSVSDNRVVFTPEPKPCSCSPLSHAHRFMGFFHNQTFALVTHSARPIDYSVSDNRVVFTPSPKPCSCTQVHCFFHNQTFALVAHSVRPIDFSVSDTRVVFTPTPTPCSCSSLSHAHRFMGFFTTKPLPLLKQILRDLLTVLYLTTE